ncbi:hypothetical protein AAVH_17607 [Aphelenchoides avenae]|nr:hypothetical protein AAVH_17607 [Aphelenchus avenae]
MVRFPTYIYGTGFPLWHLAMTVERLLSTVQADKYEYARPTFSIVCSALVWLTTVGHTAYHSWLALDDPQFRGKIVYATLSTATNVRFLTVTGQVMVGLDLSTMLLDGITVCLNRKLLKRFARSSVRLEGLTPEAVLRYQSLRQA